MHDFPWALLFAGLSAFVGALGGVASLGFWLSSKFGAVYERIAEHELSDERRFGEMRALISDAKIQAQAAQLPPRQAIQ